MSSFASLFDGFLGISVIGWALVGAIYVPATIVLVVLARGRWLKRPVSTAAAAITIYLPLLAGVTEAVYVDQSFKSLCATAGLKVRRAVVVDGFLDESPSRSGWEESLKAGKDGYRFSEWIDHKGMYWRSEIVEPGVVRRFPIDKPSAQYSYRWPASPSPHSHLISRSEKVVIDRTSGEVIANHVLGYRYPASIDRLWSRYMGGSPRLCGQDRFIVDKALPGIDRKEK